MRHRSLYLSVAFPPSGWSRERVASAHVAAHDWAGCGPRPRPSRCPSPFPWPCKVEGADFGDELDDELNVAPAEATVATAAAVTAEAAAAAAPSQALAAPTPEEPAEPPPAKLAQVQAAWPSRPPSRPEASTAASSSDASAQSFDRACSQHGEEITKPLSFRHSCSTNLPFPVAFSATCPL